VSERTGDTSTPMKMKNRMRWLGGTV